MRRAWLLLVIACGNRHEDEPPVSPPPVEPSKPDPRLESINPPAPFDAMKPRMKRADVERLLASAKKSGDDYETAFKGAVAHPAFDRDDQLIAITIIGPDLADVVFAKWGHGVAEYSDAKTTYTWPAAASGWSLRFDAPKNDSTLEPTLEFRAPEERIQLSAQVAPPPPFDVLRPRMKVADVQHELAAAHVAKVNGERNLPDVPVYETAIPNLVGYPSYDSEGRLVGIQIQPVKGADLGAIVIPRWGAGTVEKHGREEQHTYPPSTSGWDALLTLPDKDVAFFGQSLEFRAPVAPVAGVAIEVDGKVFGELARLLDTTLDNAIKTLGPGLHRETADEDDTAAERGAAHQGFAALHTKWSPQEWRLVAHTDPKTEHIVRFSLAGTTTTDNERRVLFDALRTTFGAPTPVVSDTGRVVIRFAKNAVVREIVDNEWEITIAR
jgi:hypothetical protein